VQRPLAEGIVDTQVLGEAVPAGQASQVVALVALNPGAVAKITRLAQLLL